MKKLVLIVALLLGAVGAFAENAFEVRTKSGENVSFRYADKPELKYVGSTVTITTAGATPVTFELEDVDVVKFSNDPASVETVTPENTIAMYVDAVGIHFTGAEPGAPVLVVSLDGRVVVSTTAPDGEYTLATGDLAKGVYIVKINRFSTKIIL